MKAGLYSDLIIFEKQIEKKPTLHIRSKKVDVIIPV